MKQFYLFLMVLYFSTLGIGIRAGESQENIPPNVATPTAKSSYLASGDRQGKVTVRDAFSLEVIRTFQMDSGVVVREVFLLDGGKTVAASQKDKAVFWDLDTGREIRRLNQRIYGFSHDEKKLFTQNIEGVFLYAYPDLTQMCKLTKGPKLGAQAFRFSPDDGFLAIRFSTGYPQSDEYYPRTGTVVSAINSTNLFNIQTCQEIKEFSALWISHLGEFSPDSRFYDLKIDGGRLSKGSWRFDLTTYKIQKLSE